MFIRGLISFAFLGFALSLAGCGSEAPPRKLIQAEKSAEEEIRAILDKAGIKGEIVAITDQPNFWTVAVSDPPPIEEPKPGERPKPGRMVPPKSYNISKKDKTITDSFDNKKIKS